MQTDPLHVFAFLDLDHPPVAWAVMRGMLVSADQFEGASHPGFLSFMQAGIIEARDNRRLFNEFLIEVIRASAFSHRISRMRGMYFFRSREDALARIGDRKWPRYFRTENLLELLLYPASLPTIVDANWITYAPVGQDFRISSGELSWVASYWSGAPYDEKPVWELISQGVALVPDTQVRRRCFEYVKELFPKAHIPILMSRLASEAGSFGGAITPYLMALDERRLKLGYIWKDDDFQNEEVIKKIHTHPDSGFLGRLMAENETWNMPDFSEFGCVVELGSQAVPGISSLTAPTVHKSHSSS